MIYTLTLNPSIDYLVNVDDFTLGKVNRGTSDNKFPGGKGINVSRVLKNFEIDSICLGFIGGFTGEFIDNFLKTTGIKTDFIKIAGDSRINVKIKSSQETELNGSGPKVSNDDLNKLFNKLEKLNSNDILVLAGSIQKSLPSNLYFKIQKLLNKNVVKVIVDTSGKPLLEAIKLKPFLIKPNNHEIEEIFNVKISNDEELIHYGKELVHMGAENVIISLGSNGAILITKDKVFKGNAPKGTVKNSVGAGDSLVAGFLSEYIKEKNIVDSFKMGIATGSASAFSIDLCTKNDVNNLLSEINIKEI